MNSGSRPAERATPRPLERYSPRLVAGFSKWLPGYLRRHFEVMALARDGLPPADAGGPLLIYSNHPSWWDPLHFLLLARRHWPHRRHFGPFDADALGQYGLLERIGAYGVDASTRRGAADFLRTSRAILARDDTLLLITAQGEFTDPRRRPIELRPGTAHLARSLEGGQIVPLAVEYPFGTESRPRALARFGRPLSPAAAPGRSVAAWNDALVEALTETSDRLAELAISRALDPFDIYLSGRGGVGGLYDLGRRAIARLRGRRFDPRHDPGARDR